MITNAILTLARYAFRWTLALLPGNGNLPTWLSEVTSGIARIVSGMASWSVWVPWTQLAIIAVSLFTLWGFSFTTHLIQKLISHIPFIGGA